jgi:carbamoyltransferase
MPVILGIGGASRNAALALCQDGRIVGVCEHERITRTRRAPLSHGQIPRETLRATLQLGNCEEDDISTYAVAESGIQAPSERPVALLDHHLAHASTAFYTSPFSQATILVCDRRGVPELTVWSGDARGIRRHDLGWRGPGLASIYSHATEAMGFGRDDEHRLESLARVGERRPNAAIPAIAYRGDSFDVPAHFAASIASAVGHNGSSASMPERASLARQLQQQVGDLLLDVANHVRRQVGGANLCLAGGLFYNSYFTTLLASSGLFTDTFVPANPGNAGVAVGAAFTVGWGGVPPVGREPLSPFLGPEFSAPAIKTTLDNCKLSYDYLRGDQILDRTVTALVKGKLVGWFQGRMEWGVRALGNRSILASPVAPYVLENLNRFLKQREPHRTYSVAICAEDLPRFFRGPSKSLFMEYEHEVLDRDLLKGLLPERATRLRVQTVEQSSGEFYRLIRAFGDATGVPMLVNTSFNGFNEPIVCSPRDAVRVFYGTGLDMAVLESLVLQK